MPLTKAIKHVDEESALVRRRVQLAGAAVLAISLAILARVFYLQVLQHDHFTTLAQSNRIKILPVPPVRGLIFSSDGVLLAGNRSTFTLEIVPEQVEEELDALIKALGEVVAIAPEDLQRFQASRVGKRRFEGVPLRFNLSEVEVARLAVNRHRFSGVEIVARLNRHYPLGENLSHAVGYVGMIDEDEFERLDRSNYSGTTHIGKSGVEKAYEGLLHGYVGYQQVEVNAQGKKIREIEKKRPEPSKDLYLTIDASLQALAASSLRGRRGAVVGLEPNTGAILVAVSSPGYDPNLFVNGIDRTSYRALLGSKATPLLNRFLQGKYPPGSTIKPFLSLGALQAGWRKPEAKTWCKGWYSLPNSSHRYRDWKKEGHGSMNMINAIAQSCDVYFYALAHDAGVDEAHRILSEFGFGARTNIDIGGEAAGLVPSREWKKEKRGEAWYPGETLILGIGQGAMLATPMQLAVATAAVANRGRRVRPYLLAEARDSVTGRRVIKTSARAAGPRVSADDEHWALVIDAMREVTHGSRGTARGSGAGAAYEFAGKTGTAQVIAIAQDEEYDEDEVPEELRDHALFVAFAPVAAPRIALVVIVENGGSGSATAAPVARALFDHYLGKQLSG